MKVVARFTDVDGRIGTRIDNLRWLLNLVSAYIKGGTRITIESPGGKIEVERQTDIVSDLLQHRQQAQGR